MPRKDDSRRQNGSSRAFAARQGGARNAEGGFRELQRGLTGSRSLIGASYMDNPSLLRAYLDFYWPISFEQTRRAFAVSALLAGAKEAAFPFLRVIDVGSGPGPVAAAFVGAGAEDVVLIDQSARALDLARDTIPARCGRGIGLGTARITTVVVDISRPEPSSIPLWGRVDCVSFGHSLNEVAANRDDRVAVRTALLERYAEALAPGGVILVIEPALLSTSRDLIGVRNLLVDRGWRVVAPCPGRSFLPCPALAAGAAQTCHDEVSWKMPASVAALAQSMKLDKESLKMTWFMLQPPSRDETPVRDERLFRVVSDPMLNKGGRVRRLVCGASGRFSLSAPEGGPDAARSGFDALARGDFIAVDDPERRENGWGIGARTVIRRMGGFGGKGERP